MVAKKKINTTIMSPKIKNAPRRSPKCDKKTRDPGLVSLFLVVFVGFGFVIVLVLVFVLVLVVWGFDLGWREIDKKRMGALQSSENHHHHHRHHGDDKGKSNLFY